MLLHWDPLISSVAFLSYFKLRFISLCFNQSRCAKANMQRLEKQIGLGWRILHLLLHIFNCVWQPAFPKSAIWQFITSFSSCGSISCLMILLMGVYLHLPHIMTNTAIHWHLGDADKWSYKKLQLHSASLPRGNLCFIRQRWGCDEEGTTDNLLGFKLGECLKEMVKTEA